ncbi:MAG: hypothetical protein M1840_008398 [Geoglossum simile]|nr:MAG: hypothetical protein M1840_008398 [Geoglossum simile]
MQLVDELSMIYTTCALFYAIFSHGRSMRSAILLFLFVAALAISITGYYHYLEDPTFHQNMFALLTATVVLRSMYVMEVSLRPSRRDKGRSLHQPHAKSYVNASDEAERARMDHRDVEILRTMWKMIAFGLSSIAGGFLIWNLDNKFCPTLRRWRQEVGLPWGIVLEGHGWWHIMTGIAAYLNLTWGIWLRYCLNGKQDDVEFVWPSLFTSIPVVVRRDKAKPQHARKDGPKKTN